MPKPYLRPSAGAGKIAKDANVKSDLGLSLFMAASGLLLDTQQTKEAVQTNNTVPHPDTIHKPHSFTYSTSHSTSPTADTKPFFPDNTPIWHTTSYVAKVVLPNICWVNSLMRASHNVDWQTNYFRKSTILTHRGGGGLLH